jgi:hypothetical protein
LKSISGNKQREGAASHWKEFYTRARALRNQGPYRGDPVDFLEDNHATVEETLQKIEKVESYNFPKDGDPTLDAACDALSDALRNASKADVTHDTTEVKQALDNLQKAYDETAKSNTVLVRYIDVELPYSPYSPLIGSQHLKRVLLARSWMRELIIGLRDQSLPGWILVVGNPGSGESLGLSCL